MNGTFFCNKCGAQNAAGAQFCSRCGSPTNPTPGMVATSLGMPSTMPPNLTAPESASPPLYPRAAGVRYGGFWIRVLAAIIDSIILRVVVSPFDIIFGGLGLAGMMAGLPHLPFAILGSGVSLIALFFCSWLYEAFMESSSHQATLGKMIFGLKVTDLNGNRICFARATGRHFAKFLSAMTLCIGYIMVAVTERKQGLHDLLAGTLVRRT
jgi:uncharacterized RDD family membrane protein YckC